MDYNFFKNDFIGTTSTDGTGFAFGSKNTGERLVLNFKNVSTILLTKYGNFDLHDLALSDNVKELEFNGVLFKRVE